LNSTRPPNPVLPLPCALHSNSVQHGSHSVQHGWWRERTGAGISRRFADFEGSAFRREWVFYWPLERPAINLAAAALLVTGLTSSAAVCAEGWGRKAGDKAGDSHFPMARPRRKAGEGWGQSLSAKAGDRPRLGTVTFQKAGDSHFPMERLGTERLAKGWGQPLSNGKAGD